MSLPLTLPEKPPSTWKMKMLIHINFGEGKGAAIYEIADQNGTVMPFQFGYNTKEGWHGFKFPKSNKVWTWAEIRAKWPEWMKKKAESQP